MSARILLALSFIPSMAFAATSHANTVAAILLTSVGATVATVLMSTWCVGRGNRMQYAFSVMPVLFICYVLWQQFARLFDLSELAMFSIFYALPFLPILYALAFSAAKRYSAKRYSDRFARLMNGLS